MSTNREIFFKSKRILKAKRVKDITDEELYFLLEKNNNFENKTELLNHFDNEILDCKAFEKDFSKLVKGYPLQYLIGYVDFLGCRIEVGKGVLIPRPETEDLVRKTKKLIEKSGLQKGKIVDICTGSGCIAIALKKSFVNFDVFADDLSKKAIIFADKNFGNNAAKIHLYKGNKLKPFIESNLKFDVLISNPPYVRNEKEIDKSVANFEPRMAVYCDGGVSFYKNYFMNYKKVLNDKFIMAFEIGYDLVDDLTILIKKYFPENGVQYKFEEDVFGKMRYLFIVGGYDYDFFE